MIRLLLVTLICICFSNARSQTLSEKDFKLTLDGKEFRNDTTISVKELVKVKRIGTNFKWLSFKGIEVYLVSSCSRCYDGVSENYCEGNTIDVDVMTKMKKLAPGCRIIFHAVGVHDKYGTELNIPALSFTIK